MPRYRYTCRLCGEVLEGDNREGVITAAQAHYTNQHGLQHETDVKPTGIEVDEQAIRERIDEID